MGDDREGEGVAPVHVLPSGARSWNRDQAIAASAKGVASRRAKAADRKAMTGDAIGALREIGATVERGEVGAAVWAVAAHVLGRVITGAIPVRNGAEAADLLRVLVDIGRMEAGDPSRTVAVAHLSGPALAQRLRELQGGEPVSSAVLAADDDQVGGEPAP